MTVIARAAILILAMLAGTAAMTLVLDGTRLEALWQSLDGHAVALLITTSLLAGPMLFGRRPAAQISIGREAATSLMLGMLVLGGSWAYAERAELRQTALRAISALQPGYPVTLSERETVLTRERSGHFTAIALVDGVPVHMLVDTGSTDIALPFDEARRIGIDVDALEFDRAVITANGRASVAAVELTTVSVGAITLHNVKASVAQPGRLAGALLGMSFLNRLDEFRFRGDTLSLLQ
ncbi:MAG: TIGR02281 family clan AA aspartic protease [Pseudomonadota bacterium]